MLRRTLFILTLALTITQAPTATFAAESAEAKARRLVNALGCKGCHRLEGNGGSLAPELDSIGSRMTRAQIRQHLTADASTRQRGHMPSYNTTSNTELENLSEFLYNLR